MKRLKEALLAQIRGYVNFQDLSEEQAKELNYLSYSSFISVDPAAGSLSGPNLLSTITSNLSRVLKPSRWKSVARPRVVESHISGLRGITVSFWALRKPSGKDPVEGDLKLPFRVGHLTFTQIARND